LYEDLTTTHSGSCVDVDDLYC